MTRTRVKVGLCVVVRSLIFVVDEETDGCSKGDSVLGTGLNVDEIVFISLRQGRKRNMKESDRHSKFQMKLGLAA